VAIDPPREVLVENDNERRTIGFEVIAGQLAKQRKRHRHAVAFLDRDVIVHFPPEMIGNFLDQPHVGAAVTQVQPSLFPINASILLTAQVSSPR